MTKYLLLGISLALSSCAAQKALPHYTPEQQAAQRADIGYWQPDSLKAIPKLSPVAQAKLEARRRRGQAPAPLLADGGPRPLDSVVVLPPAGPQPGRGVAFWQKLNPFRKPTPAVAAVHHAAMPTRIGKKSTVNVYYGPATVSTTTAGKKATVAAGAGAVASVIEKKAGPAVVASDSSTQNAPLGGGNLAAVHGDGNTLPQTATTQQPTGELP